MIAEIEALKQENQAVAKAEKALEKAKKMYNEAYKECTMKSIARSKKAISESKKANKGSDGDGTHANEIVISQFDKSNRMMDNSCFYIKSTQKDQDGQEYVVASALKDKYAPKKTGVYNIEMQPLDPTGKKTEQKFFYKEKNHALHNMKFPDKVVFEGFNKNLMLFNYKPTSKNEKFSFDQKKKVWYNEFTDRVMSTDSKNPLAAGSNVATHDYHPDDIFHQFEMVSCEDPEVEEERLIKEAADAKEELSGEEVDGEKKTEGEEDGKDEDPSKVD
jgi:hypothetical protein